MSWRRIAAAAALTLTGCSAQQHPITPEDLLLPGIAAGAVALSTVADEPVGSYIAAKRPLGGVLRGLGEHAGHGMVNLAGSGAAYLAGTLTGAESTDELADCARAQALTAALTYALKHAVGRERPDNSDTRSFPSGHASSAWVSARCIDSVSEDPAVDIAAYALATVVSVQRVQEERHHLSDVLAGAAIGGFSYGLVERLFPEKSRVRVTPVVADGVGLRLEYAF